MTGKFPLPTPTVLGHEVSGSLVELGTSTRHTGLSVGDPVCGAFLMPCGQCPECARGRDGLCAPSFEFNRLRGQLLLGDPGWEDAYAAAWLEWDASDDTRSWETTAGDGLADASR